MPVVLIATTNPGKLREYARLFEKVPGVRIASPNDVEIWVEVSETGTTLAENALLKARALAAEAGKQRAESREQPGEDPSSNWWVLGDDSGLEVDALGGEPGVHSNRWAGPNTTAAGRNRLLLERLAGVPDEERTARFRCVVALISPEGKEHLTEGTIEGRIAHEPVGSGGFGYDPIFELPGGRRLSQLDPDQKNRISHRGIAGAKAAAIISTSG
jgi:XTP/dITP diphosphohydrolase